nr:hypothetical protein [uncultured Oscillibacter sp.]
MKIMGKDVRRGAAVLVLAAALLVAWYHFSYPVELNMVTLPKEIVAFHNRESEDWDPSEITVYGGVSVGDREYYLMEIGEYLGSVTLRRSLTGRYKIEYLRYGDGGFRNAIVESEGKKYLLLGGRDLTARIAGIAVSIDGRSYELENPNPGDHFLLCTEIDSRTEDNHIDLARLAFYNREGEDITGLYDLSGGGL